MKKIFDVKYEIDDALSKYLMEILDYHG